MYIDGNLSCRIGRIFCKLIFLTPQSFGRLTTKLSIAASILLVLIWSLNIVQGAPLNQFQRARKYESKIANATTRNSFILNGNLKGLGRQREVTYSFQDDTQPSKKDKEEILKYLFRYGYINYVTRGHEEGVFDDRGETTHEHLLRDAISVFLGMHDVRGEQLRPYSDNEETPVNLLDILEYTRQPRCSNPDLPSEKITLLDSGLEKDNIPYRYGSMSKYITGSRYRNHSQTWRLVGLEHSKNYDQLRETLQRAFLTWAKYAPLNFVEVTSNRHGPVHHEVYFVEGKHKINSWMATRCFIDVEPESTDTAHGYFPSFGGTLHINKNRRWTNRYTGRSNELNLWQTATHEIGHTLGLEHIPTKLTSSNGISIESTKQVMHPNYHEKIRDGFLGVYDAQVIQALYGKYSKASKDIVELGSLILPTPKDHLNPNDGRKYVLGFGSQKGMLNLEGNIDRTGYYGDQESSRLDISKVRINYVPPPDLTHWVDAFDSINYILDE